MRVLIAGGSGQVGRVLTRAFAAFGDDVVVLSRRPASSHSSRVVVWDARTPGDWTREVDDADVVINLTGRSVNCRYTEANKREILSSRVDSTRAIGHAIAGARRPPRLWLQASTATIYAHRFDAANDEITGVIGGSEADAPAAWRFSIDVARAWEQTLAESATPHTRKVAIRTAMMMSPDAGGIFDTLVWLVRRGLGGRSGSGRQFVSWIHDEDFVSAILWLIDHEELEGPVNFTSPNPVPNAELMTTLRRACGVSIGLPTSRWMLEAGAVFMKTETELVLKSRRVVPTRLLSSGFVFKYPTWDRAAADLCQRRRLR